MRRMTDINGNLITKNARACKCQCGCNTAYDKKIMLGFRGNNCRMDKLQYVHPEHIVRYGYGETTDNFIGDGSRYHKEGIELETNGVTVRGYMVMKSFNFKPESDCSLHHTDANGIINYGDNYIDTATEFVSDTNIGFKRLIKQLPIIEELLQSGDMYMDESCGTHAHISCPNYRQMRPIELEELFSLMENEMRRNIETTEKLFGRKFSQHYAHPLDGTWDRYNWVNTENSTNLEFRLNKFVSAEQYSNLLRFEIDVVKALVSGTTKYELLNMYEAFETSGKWLWN